MLDIKFGHWLLAAASSFMDLHETYTRHWSHEMLVAYKISGQKIMKVRVTGAKRSFCCVCSVPIWPICFICGTNNSPWRDIFRSKGQSSRSHWSFEMKVTPVNRRFCHACSVAPSLFGWITSYVAYIQHMRGRCVMHHFQDERSKVKVTWVVQIFYCVCSVALSLFHRFTSYEIHTQPLSHTMCRAPFPGQKVQGHTGHLKFSSCLLHGFLLIWPNHFICGIHTTHERATHHASFSVRKVNGQGHMGLFKFWPCPLCGFVPIWLNHLYVAYIQHIRGWCVAPHFQDQRSKVKVTQVTSHLGPVCSVALSLFGLITSNTWGDGVHTIFRMKGQKSRSHGSFQVLALSTSYVAYIHEGAMWRTPFSGWKVKG